MAVTSSFFLLGLTIVLYAASLTNASSPTLSVTTTPAPKKPKNIKFYCIHSYDTTYKETGLNKQDISKNLDLQLDFAFYVHGWQSEFNIDDEDSISYQIGLEWVKAEETNFCGVDWKCLADDNYFIASTKRVRTVGAELAAFIVLLYELGVKLSSVSIAGHSLGAHVAGFAGQSIFKTFGTKISTIFGLDPAGPLFTTLQWANLGKYSNFVLDKDHAHFVQILHTSKGTFGTTKLIGHADFIVNNGIAQKSCVGNLLFSCSHSYANNIFLSSFAHVCFGAFVKSNEELTSGLNDVYGIHNDKMPGVFDLNTSEEEPYCNKRLDT